MSDIRYQLIRIQGDDVTALCDDHDRPPIQALCDQMNAHAPDGVTYQVRTVEVQTRPLRVIEEPTP